MSTRAVVAIVDKWTDPDGALLFYRHGDGYPDGVRQTLDIFCRWVNERRIRQSPTQSSGWLVFLGIQELLCTFHVYPYRDSGEFIPREEQEAIADAITIRGFEPSFDHIGHTWEIGSYQPTEAVPSDAEWLHVVYIGDRYDMRQHIPEERLREAGETASRPAFWRSFPAGSHDMAQCIRSVQESVDG